MLPGTLMVVMAPVASRMNPRAWPLASSYQPATWPELFSASTNVSVLPGGLKVVMAPEASRMNPKSPAPAGDGCRIISKARGARGRRTPRHLHRRGPGSPVRGLAHSGRGCGGMFGRMRVSPFRVGTYRVCRSKLPGGWPGRHVVLWAVIRGHAAAHLQARIAILFYPYRNQNWSFAFFPSARRTGSQIALLAIETPGATRGHRGKWIMS